MEQSILPLTDQYKKYSQAITPFLQSPKTKNYSTVILFFLVLSVFGWYAIRPTIQTILYLRREIKDKTEIDKKMDIKIYSLIEANTVYENNQALFPILAEAIPISPEALDAVSQIKLLAAEKNVAISLLQMSNIQLASQSTSVNQKNQNNFTEIPIICNVEGPFASILAFLKELTTMRRFITIRSMNFLPIKTIFVSASESGKPTFIKASIDLITYYETK